MPELSLTRPTGYRVDRGRKYQIYIDRKKVESMKIGETKVFTQCIFRLDGLRSC